MLTSVKKCITIHTMKALRNIGVLDGIASYKETVYHKMPKKISPKGLKELENLRHMNDDAIDYSDAPPLNKKQLDEVARIVRERKERMPSITLRLPSPVLDKYKELGKGYTSVMAHILCEYIQEHRHISNLH